MKMKIALSAAALFAAQAASATTLNLTYVEAANGFAAVDIDAAPISVAGGQTSVPAGGFVMNDATGGFGDFLAWCLDLGAFLGTSGSHEYTTSATPFSNSFGLDSAGIARVSSIFNANFGAAVTATTDASAAFQVALWEVVYDDDMNIGTGAFQASSSGNVETLAAGYLAAAANYAGPNLFDVTYLESTAADRAQNIVTVSAVPLPAAGLMLGFAVAGLGAARRFKKS